MGFPGTGKSLTAKATAAEYDLPLLRFDIGSIFASLLGESEQNLRHALKVAESVAPVIFWIDEIDKAFAGSRGDFQGDGGTASRVLGYFLTWMQETRAPVFVIATANDIHRIPEPLRRPGRLDDTFRLDLPTCRERKEIFRIFLRRVRERQAPHLDKFGDLPPLELDQDEGALETLAEESYNFSGAEVEEAVFSALGTVFGRYGGQRQLTVGEIRQQLRAMIPQACTFSLEYVEQMRAESIRPASGEAPEPILPREEYERRSPRGRPALF